MLKQKKSQENQKENKTSKMSVSKVEQYISELKSQNALLKQQTIRLKDKASRDKLQNERQIKGLKDKISSLNEKQITNYLFKPHQVNESPMYESTCKKITIELAIATESLQQEKNKVNSLTKEIDQLTRTIESLKAEKEAHVEYSVLEKIQLQDRCNLLQKEVQSKKMIIESLGSRNARVNQLQANLINQERKIVQRGKQMQKYEKQFSQHFKNNEQIMNEKLKRSENENSFLKERIQKILKSVRHKCKCANENSEWKNKLYNLGRELVKTKVQLSKYTLNNQKKSPKDRSSSSQNESIDSLKLSCDSDESNPKETQKKHKILK